MRRDRKKDVLKTRDGTDTHTHTHRQCYYMSVSQCAMVPHTCPVLSFQPSQKTHALHMQIWLLFSTAWMIPQSPPQTVTFCQTASLPFIPFSSHHFWAWGPRLYFPSSSLLRCASEASPGVRVQDDSHCVGSTAGGSSDAAFVDHRRLRTRPVTRRVLRGHQKEIWETFIFFFSFHTQASSGTFFFDTWGSEPRWPRGLGLLR